MLICGLFPSANIWQLAGLFARIHLVEQIGSGVKRINQLMNEAKLPAPQFKTEGMFVVVMQRKKKTTQKTSEKTTQKTVQKTTQKATQKTEN